MVGSEAGGVASSVALRDRLFGIDARSLAAFRIGLGTAILADLLTRAGALEAHYTDAGVLPRAAVARLLGLSDWHWSVHSWTGSVAGEALLFTLAAVAAVALVVGYRTRLATVVSWFLLVSLQARNPMVLYGADQLLRLLLFWSMFLPLGGVWSVDRGRPTPRGACWHVTSMASAALLLQPCVMYVFSGLLKLNPAWTSGQALEHALAADMYARPLAHRLLEYPWVLQQISQAVPWFEMLVPAALFVPKATATVRRVGLVALVAFHVAIGALLTTGLFPLVCLVGLLPFIPGSLWVRVSVRRPQPASGSVEPLTAMASRLVRPARRRLDHAVQVVVALLFVYVLAWNVAGVGVEEYTMRQSLGWYREWWAAGRSGVPLTFRDYGVERMLGRVGWIGRVASLHQRWDMFHRVDAGMRGWPLVIATLPDGRQISILEHGRPFAGAAHERPEVALAFYPGARWLVYFTYLRGAGTQPARNLLPAVVARDWNRAHPDLPIETLRIVFVQEPAPDGEESAAQNLWYEGIPITPVGD